jgi:hypothetical protein
VLYVGDPAEGEAAVRPLRSLSPSVDLIGPTTYAGFQASLDATAPPGWRSYWRGEYLPALPDDALDTFLRDGTALVEAARPLTQAVIFRIGQSVAGVPEDATAASHRGANYLFHPIVVWENAADDARLTAAGRTAAEAMRAFGDGGAYLNFTPETDRVRDAYGAAKYDLLVALKDEYDPENVFRLNQNVAPNDVRSTRNALRAPREPSSAHDEAARAGSAR